MNHYQPRTYREKTGLNRFLSFSIAYLETDLWIGYTAHDRPWSSEEVKSAAFGLIQELRRKIDAYARVDDSFLGALTPYRPSARAPALVRKMFQAGQKAGVGPMAAVAGAIAESVGHQLKKKFYLNEIVVENGGDVFLDIQKPCLVAIQAGTSPLSGMIGLEIDQRFAPIGVCTSSGTVGPSLSFGRADAVTIACAQTALADAYATYFGNRVRGPADIEFVLDEIGRCPDIIAGLIITGERLGLRGALPLRIINQI